MNAQPTPAFPTLPGAAPATVPSTQAGVCALLLNERWEVLLHRQPGGWALPGGPSRPGEALEVTLQRCLREQVGWPPLDPMLLTVISGPDTLTGLPGHEQYQVCAAYVIRPGRPGEGAAPASAGQFFPLDDLPGQLGVVATRALNLLRVCLGMA